eukprot:TRINITY_DN6042_c0_g2_i2.p1 TRINITY_DN6042_c0_g2~~TRINITY_DN6042_c0_g2_i2.p1  ORF type:complete len:194 (-),score=64.87 TRINITY_DN6042_c0_g2_i2:107-688(-)
MEGNSSALVPVMEEPEDEVADGRIQRVAMVASTTTRSLVNGTRTVLERMGAERAIEVVRKGQAGSLTGLVMLDHGLAQLGHVNKALSFADNFAAWMTGEYSAAIAFPDLTRQSVVGDEEETDRNYLLQKAIRLYMESEYHLNCDDMMLSLVPAQQQPETDSDPPSPVSYTHLRAHETPEHLVCRLLLEKKKKN